MIAAGWLWAVFTVIAAIGQTARNAMQRELTRVVGTVGATFVRFLFGLPFGILFLAGVAYWLATPPEPNRAFLAWNALASVKGRRSNVDHRCSRVRPASCAIRSSSAGHA